MTPEEKINKIIAETLGVYLDEISAEKSIIDDLGADSLDVVELIMTLEEEVDVEISDDEAEKLRTIQDIHDFIKNNGEQ